MAQFKIVISDPKKGKSIQKEVKDDAANVFLGKKIKDVIKGEVIDMTGYEFEITGGSDYCGFPMRYDNQGSARKMITAVSGIGMKPISKGMRQSKTVAGNTIHAKTAQINLKILKQGKTPLFEEKKEEPKEGEAKPAEKKE